MVIICRLVAVVASIRAVEAFREEANRYRGRAKGGYGGKVRGMVYVLSAQIFLPKPPEASPKPPHVRLSPA